MSEERYKNAKIYTIRYRNDDSLIYIGSTCLPLYKRWYNHKHTCFNINNKEYNRIVYQKIRETDDFDNWYIELYDEFPCENKEQLLKHEGEVIRELGTLNTKIEGRSKKERYEENKDKLSTYYKGYYQDNKETIMDRTKEYRDKHRETIREKDNERYSKNKETISEQRKEKITCLCGCEVVKCQLKRHQQTKKHLDLINSNSSENNGDL
jgi:hypothetical protein